MPKAKCPSCATVVTYAAGYDPICPQCGFRGAAPAVPQAPPAAWSAVGSSAATQQAYTQVPAPAGPGQGAYTAPGAAYPVQGRQQGMAVAALVCGLVGIVFFPVAIAAIVLGAIAMSQADRDPQRFGGKGMAVAGLVLGILFFLFWASMFGGMGMWDDDLGWDW